MAFNFTNKHIIGKLRNILNDSSDTKYPIEEKVDIINGALNLYGKYIWNYKRKTIQIENDNQSYLHPEDFNSTVWCSFSNSTDKLVVESDYIEYDDKIVLRNYSYSGATLNYSTDLDLFYDAKVQELFVSDVGNKTAGAITLTIDSSKFDVGEYIMIKDETNEEVVVITGKTDTTITFTITKNYTNGYIIGNAKIDLSDYDILASYGKYYDKIKTIGQADSIQWQQGQRSQTISYGASGQITSGNSFDKTLQAFIDLLKTHKNYKFKTFQGFQTIGFYK